MKKLFKPILLALLGITVASLLFYFFTLSRMEFNFGNEGKIICITKRDWGFLSSGNITCFTYQKIGDDKAVQTFKCETLNGEIILSK